MARSLPVRRPFGPHGCAEPVFIRRECARTVRLSDRAPYDFAAPRGSSASSASRTRWPRCWSAAGSATRGAARAWLAGDRRTTRRLRRASTRPWRSSSATPRGRAHHRPRRLRRRRRLLDGDPRPRAARAGRRRRLVPARAAPRTATGCRAATVERLAARGTRLLVTVDCAITAVDEVAAARARRASTSSSPTTTRRAPTARCRTRRSCTRRSAATRAPTSAPPASPTSSRGALLAAPGATRRADEDLDLVALATVADCVPLRGENRRLVRDGPARAGRARAKPGPARADARRAGGPERARRTRVGFRLAPRHQRRGPAAPRRRRARAAADRRRRARRARSPTSSTRVNAERRHVEQRILFEAEAQVAERGRAHRVRARRRGLAPGRDRDRRLAHRRAPPPPGGARSRSTASRGRARAARSPAFDLLGGLARLRASTSRATAATAPPPAAPSRADVDAFRAAFEAHAAAVLRARGPRPGRARRRGRRRRRARHDAGRGARAPRAVRHGQPRVALLVPRPG